MNAPVIQLGTHRHHRDCCCNRCAVQQMSQVAAPSYRNFDDPVGTFTDGVTVLPTPRGLSALYWRARWRLARLRTWWRGVLDDRDSRDALVWLAGSLWGGFIVALTVLALTGWRA